MKIYAIRDRLIDYFLMPFAAPGDKEVMSALSKRVNYGQTEDDVCQAPHHFELWKLGEVLEDGTLTPKKELICDCSSLVRARRESPESRPREVSRADAPLDPTPHGPTNANGASERPIARQVESAHGLRTTTPGVDSRSN